MFSMLGSEKFTNYQEQTEMNDLSEINDQVQISSTISSRRNQNMSPQAPKRQSSNKYRNQTKATQIPSSPASSKRLSSRKTRSTANFQDLSNSEESEQVENYDVDEAEQEVVEEETDIPEEDKFQRDTQLQCGRRRVSAQSPSLNTPSHPSRKISARSTRSQSGVLEVTAPLEVVAGQTSRRSKRKLETTMEANNQPELRSTPSRSFLSLAKSNYQDLSYIDIDNDEVSHDSSPPKRQRNEVIRKRKSPGTLF